MAGLFFLHQSHYQITSSTVDANTTLATIKIHNEWLNMERCPAQIYSGYVGIGPKHVLNELFKK